MSYSNNISNVSGLGLNSTATSSSSGAKRFAAGLTKGFANALGSATGVNIGGVSGDGQLGDVDLGTDNFQELMEIQIRAQKELQIMTMQSNLAKTEHDTRMAAVRNMRP